MYFPAWLADRSGDVFLGREIWGHRIIPRIVLLGVLGIVLAFIRVYLAIVVVGFCSYVWYSFLNQFCWSYADMFWRQEIFNFIAWASRYRYMRFGKAGHSSFTTNLAAVRKPRPSEVTVARTSRDAGERLAEQPSVWLSPSPPNKDEPTVFLDPTVTYQTYLGFGGAFTESSADVLGRIGSANQERVIDAYFNKSSGLGYNLGRVHMNSCDFSHGNWSCCDKSADPPLANFTVEHYQEAIFPMIKRAMTAAGGPFQLLASPWSPPAWMKDTETMLRGGKLKTECRQIWADFYVRFAKELKSLGFPLWGFSVQNEPDAANSWENCLFSPEEERDFIRDHLGPALQSSGMDLKLIGWDHNRSDLFLRAQTIYADPNAAKYVWGMGYHWYGDPRAEWWAERAGGVCFDNVARVHDLQPEKHLLVTETCQELGPHIGDWAVGERYAESIIKDFNNWCEGWIDWNLYLDESGGPNHVGNMCSAPIIADTENDKVLFQPSYFYIGHFTRYIQPGAKRILCACSRDVLQATAFANPDGTFVVVVMNTSDQGKDFAINFLQSTARTTAPSHSISTFTLFNLGHTPVPPELMGLWEPTRVDEWHNTDFSHDERTRHFWDAKGCMWATGIFQGTAGIHGKDGEDYIVSYTNHVLFGQIYRGVLRLMEDGTFEIRLDTHNGGFEAFKKVVDTKAPAEYDTLIDAVLSEDVDCILTFKGDLNKCSRPSNADSWTTPPPPGGCTALCAAVVHGKERSLDALLKAGADPSVPDGNGALPAAVAQIFKRQGMLDALQAAASSTSREREAPAAESTDPETQDAEMEDSAPSG